MTYHRFIYSFVVLVSMFLGVGCEDVIELNLDDTPPQIVIAANLDASQQHATVVLRQTSDFYDSQAEIPLRDAVIELQGPEISYLLEEVQDGIYQAEGILLQPYDTFSVQVAYAGEIYTATSTVPTPVALLDIEQSELPDTPFRDKGDIRLSAIIDDDPEVENFYRITLNQEKELVSENITVFDDAFAAPNEIFKVPIRETFQPGTIIQVTLLSTDQAYYNYFYQLALLTGEGSNNTTPFNPKGNFDNKALGYFGIFYSSTSEITIE